MYHFVGQQNEYMKYYGTRKSFLIDSFIIMWRINKKKNKSINQEAKDLYNYSKKE